MGKKSKNVFDFLSSGLGINVSLFRLRQFEEVGSELGSHEAGVEIGAGGKRALFYTFWKKAGHCRTNTLGAMNFLIFFYFSHFCENRDFSLILFFGPYLTRQKRQDVTQIDPEFYDASFCISFCLRERNRERER